MRKIALLLSTLIFILCVGCSTTDTGEADSQKKVEELIDELVNMDYESKTHSFIYNNYISIIEPDRHSASNFDDYSSWKDEYQDYVIEKTAEEAATELLRDALYHPNSLEVNRCTVKIVKTLYMLPDTDVDDYETKYFADVTIDYSAQNQLGGYGREEIEINLVSVGDPDVIDKRIFESASGGSISWEKKKREWFET